MIGELQYLRNRIKKKEETSNNESENPRSNTSKITLTESEKEAIFEIKDLLKQVWKLDKTVKRNVAVVEAQYQNRKFLLLLKGSIFLLGSVLLKK